MPLIGSVRGWQLVFLMLGPPGVLLSLAMLLVPEPVRMGTGHSDPSPSMKDLLQHLKRHWQAYFGIGIGIGFLRLILVCNATGASIPAFLQRKYGLTTDEVGSTYGAITAVCGVGGTLIGGFPASALRRRGYERANLHVALGLHTVDPRYVHVPANGRLPRGAGADRNDDLPCRGSISAGALQHCKN